MKKEKQFWDWFNENKLFYENIFLNLNKLNQQEIDKAMDTFENELHI